MVGPGGPLRLLAPLVCVIAQRSISRDYARLFTSQCAKNVHMTKKTSKASLSS